MRKIISPAVVGAVAALAAAAGPAARAAAVRDAPAPPPISLEAVTTPALGNVVADLDGMTLYKYDAEVGGKIACAGPCLDTWIPLWHKPREKLYLPQDWRGTIGWVKRPEGTEQVTFDGSPLYLYAGDQQPGDTNGDFSATDPATLWHAVPAPPTG